jgi:UrcA family protein
MNTVTNAQSLRRLRATALCGVIASSAAALPAVADNFAPGNVRVTFGDLDVSRPQGAAVLYGRIRAAAEKVCSPLEASRLAAGTYLDACIDKAVSEAVTKVDQPALSIVYSAKKGVSLPIPLVSPQMR